MILSQYVGDSYYKINTLIAEKDFSFREAEKEVIGIDHAELGAMVAETWKFSPKMVAIIRNHHHPDGSLENYPETAIVYMADILCLMMGIGGGSDGLAYRFHHDVVEYLGITERDFQEIMAGFGEKLEEVETLI